MASKQLAVDEVQVVDRAVSDFLTKNGRVCLLKLFKSKNRHALCYEMVNGAIDLVWVLVRKEDDGSYNMKIEEVNFLHKMVLGADLESNFDGSVTLKLRSPVSFEVDMKVVQDEDNNPMVVVPHEGDFAILNLLYVNLDEPKESQVHAFGIHATLGHTINAIRTVDLSGLPIE